MFRLLTPSSLDYSINSNFEVVRGDLLKVDEEIMESSDFVNYCKDQAKKTLEDAAGDSIKETKVLEGFNSCLAKGLAPKLLQAEEELNFQSGVREEAAPSEAPEWKLFFVIGHSVDRQNLGLS